MHTHLSHRAALLATIGILAFAPAVRGQAAQQAVRTNIASVGLKSFTPIDSLFFNSAATSFNIALVHSATGTPTEYRVSRFADFRDANWIPYNSRPTLVVPRTWFSPAAADGSQSVTLHFQLRVKNPMGGRPVAVVNGVATFQPDFYFSDVRVGTLKLIYFG